MRTSQRNKKFCSLLVMLILLAMVTQQFGSSLAMAQEGKKVLLIDMDPQASLTLSLGFRNPDDLYPTTTDIMNNVIEDGEITKEFSVYKKSI